MISAKPKPQKEKAGVKLLESLRLKREQKAAASSTSSSATSAAPPKRTGYGTHSQVSSNVQQTKARLNATVDYCFPLISNLILLARSMLNIYFVRLIDNIRVTRKLLRAIDFS